MLDTGSPISNCRKMEVPMIAELIYKGATAADLEMSEVEYNSRKETLERFLKTWSGGDFQPDYLAWLEIDQAPSIQADVEEAQYDPQIREGQPWTMAEKAKGLTDSVKKIFRSGFDTVDKEIANQRYLICESCIHLSAGQCEICGCFMKVKTKFAAMECPINKW